jgi:AcrR family transcriptional regulator
VAATKRPALAAANVANVAKSVATDVAKRLSEGVKHIAKASGARAARASRTRLDVDERRAQLLAVGMEVFGAQDYDAVSIDEIARRLGISKGLLYHYFPTKKDFFAASVEAAAEQLLERTQIDERLPPPERLRQGLTAYLRFVEGYRATFVALMRGRSSGSIAKILERTRQRLLDRIVTSLPFPEEQRSDPRVVLALRGWIGFVEALSLEWAAREPDAVSLEEPLSLAMETFVTCMAWVARGWQLPVDAEALRRTLLGLDPSSE